MYQTNFINFQAKKTKFHRSGVDTVGMDMVMAVAMDTDMVIPMVMVVDIPTTTGDMEDTLALAVSL